MPRAAPALVVTAVAVVLLARYDTTPPRTFNPNSALRPADAPRPAAATKRPRLGPGQTAATGPALTTPFSVIQVRAILTRGRLTGVETVALAGDGPYTNALNRRAEKVLREEVLRAGSADVDAVTGATSTSEGWLQSLRGAIKAARRG
jgi:uncharacterized protein with FMN-binding domain